MLLTHRQYQNVNHVEAVPECYLHTGSTRMLIMHRLCQNVTYTQAVPEC